MTLKRKLKTCKTCGQECFIFSNGNCKKCAAKAKAPKTVKREPRKKLVPITKLKKDARYWFQRWIRLRDLGNTCCYGSGYKLEDIKYYDACHYLKFELYPEAGFDEDNVFGGSKGENIRDNTIAYRRELVRRKGEQWVKNLEDKYCVSRETQFKWDRNFLESIIDKYKDRCKEIESNK
jgi:hypothetical protein